MGSIDIRPLGYTLDGDQQETANSMSEGLAFPNFYEWKSNRQYVCDTQVHKNHHADGLSLNAQYELPRYFSSPFRVL